MKYIFLLILTGFLGYSIFFGIFKNEEAFISKNTTTNGNTQVVQTPPPSEVLENQIHREKCGKNACFVNNECIIIPVHASCNDEENGIILSKAWSCKEGYIDQDNTCMCQSGSYVCKNNQEEVNILDENVKIKEGEIKQFIIDEEDEKSVLIYNSLIDTYNKLVAERNIFMNETCFCEGAYNFSEVFDK